MAFDRFPYRLNRVEVWRIGWQKDKLNIMSAGLLDYGGRFVTAKVVQYDGHRLMIAIGGSHLV